MAVKTNVRAKVEVRARLHVLYDVVGELVAGFGGTDTEDRLRRGILDHQIIHTVYLYYLNAAGKRVTHITIEIDWERHAVLARTSEGESIALDADPIRSVLEKVHGFLPKIVAHTRRLREHYQVARVVLGYKYLPEIQEDPDQAATANDILGVRAARLPWIEPEDLPEDISDLETAIEFSPGNLRELKVTVYHPPGLTPDRP